jgi:hypothetical protein
VAYVTSISRRGGQGAFETFGAHGIIHKDHVGLHGIQIPSISHNAVVSRSSSSVKPKFLKPPIRKLGNFRPPKGNR